MHIDLNSCFATVEQQANPFLRGKPIAVAAYASPNGCILAPSIEAKKFGVKTGMRVKEGKLLCPHLLVLPPDPWKYRNVHLKLRSIFKNYTSKFAPKSIDEFVLHFDASSSHLSSKNLLDLGSEIRNKIYDTGDWLHVSIGIGPNRFLAKTASGMQKPCGLVEINQFNFLENFAKLKLTDLCGIASRNQARLNTMGIFTVLDFYNSPLWKNRAAFHSIGGYYWFLRLRGYEIDAVEFARRSYGNSYSLPQKFTSLEDLSPILMKLVEKTSFRLRRANLAARGVHLEVIFKGAYWHHGRLVSRDIFDARDIYREIYKVFLGCPYLGMPVVKLSVSCFQLTKQNQIQLELFSDVPKKLKLTKALDDINNRFGEFVVYSGRMAKTQKFVPDRIAFGGVKELEEFTKINN